VRQYRRKPKTLEAAQLPPMSEAGAMERWEAIRAWCGGRLGTRGSQTQVLLLDTLAGRMWAGESDWIVGDTEAGFSALSADAFTGDYEPVDEPAPGN